ncbi:MAG TPA: TIGR00725 family protein, partial [Pyrinomonadaceae bacterium]
MKTIIGIIGGHQHNTTERALLLAERVGAELAHRGFAIICGGYNGIMEAACRGCKEADGTTIGVLKGNDPAAANPYIDYVIATSMDLASNHIIIWSSSAIIAFEGMYGTLTEIALALDTGKPLISMG